MITLGIIGVVAAITIPVLIQHHQKQETVTKLKKVYSTFGQVYTMSIAQNGDFDALTWADDDERKKVFEDYFLKYFKTIKYCGNETEPDCFPLPVYNLGNDVYIKTVLSTRYSFVLKDGTSVLAWLGSSGDHIQFMVNLNGEKGKNTLGKDVFQMTINFETKRLFFPIYATTDTFIKNPNRNNILEDGDFACNKTAKRGGTNCGALIQLDGWQIADDYPW